MIRYLLIAVLLSGCSIAERREAQRQQLVEQVGVRCGQLGFKPDTQEFTNCKLELYKTAVSGENARRTAVAGSSETYRQPTTCQTYGNTTTCN